MRGALWWRMLLVTGTLLAVEFASASSASQNDDGNDDGSADDEDGVQEGGSVPTPISGGGGGGGSGSGLDLKSLQGSLKSGGAAGLVNMLKAMRAMRAGSGSDAAAMHIKKDDNGEAVYDFRDMEPSATPAPPAPKPNAPHEVALPVGVPGAAAVPVVVPSVAATLPRRPMPAAAPLPVSAAVRSNLAPMAVPSKFAPDAPAGSKRSVGVRWPSAVSAPVAANDVANGLVDAGVPQVAQQRPQNIADPVANSFAAATPPIPNSAPAQGSSELEALAQGLASVRSTVDALAAEADTVAHGKVASPALARAQEQPQAQSQADREMPQLQADVKALLARVQVLEKDNKDMRQELAAQGTQLKAVEADEEEEKQVIASEKTENAKLEANITKLMTIRHKRLRVVRKRHGHKAIKAQSKASQQNDGQNDGQQITESQ